MNAGAHRQPNRRERRLLRRVGNKPGVGRPPTMMATSDIHHQFAERGRAIAPGGFGTIHLRTRKLGNVRDIDERLDLLGRSLPYREGDHVLNIARSPPAARLRRETVTRSAAFWLIDRLVRGVSAR